VSGPSLRLPILVFELISLFHLGLHLHVAHLLPNTVSIISFSATMSRISIPLDAIAARFNLQGRFDGVLNGNISNRFANLKPISEFLDIKRISKPANFSEVQSRVNYNLGHFSSNYAVVFVMLSIYSLLTNRLLLFVIVLVVVGMYGIGKLDGRDLELGVTRVTSSQLYTGMLVLAIPLGFWASPFTTVLWLIGATGVSVIGHASFMDRPIENAFSEEAV
jgi:PRA1 family protein 1